VRHDGLFRILRYDRLFHCQVQPFPLIRLLPIPRLQKIVASDSAVTRYVMDLYDQADEKPIEEGKSILVGISESTL